MICISRISPIYLLIIIKILVPVKTKVFVFYILLIVLIYYNAYYITNVRKEIVAYIDFAS